MFKVVWNGETFICRKVKKIGNDLILSGRIQDAKITKRTKNRKYQYSGTYLEEYYAEEIGNTTIGNIGSYVIVKLFDDKDTILPEHKYFWILNTKGMAEERLKANIEIEENKIFLYNEYFKDDFFINVAKEEARKYYDNKSFLWKLFHDGQFGGSNWATRNYKKFLKSSCNELTKEQQRKYHDYFRE